MRLTMERTLHQVRMVVDGHTEDCIDSRPDLCALLRYDSEAYLLLAELDPCERTERVEGRSELCDKLAEIMTLRCVHITCKSGDVLYLGFEAHRASWWRGTDASRKCSERGCNDPRHQRHCHYHSRTHRGALSTAQL
jgi:hypothetical protein